MNWHGVDIPLWSSVSAEFLAKTAAHFLPFSDSPAHGMRRYRGEPKQRHLSKSELQSLREVLLAPTSQHRPDEELASAAEAISNEIWTALTVAAQPLHDQAPES